MVVASCSTHMPITKVGNNKVLNLTYQKRIPRKEMQENKEIRQNVLTKQPKITIFFHSLILLAASHQADVTSVFEM